VLKEEEKGGDSLHDGDREKCTVRGADRVRGKRHEKGRGVRGK